MTTNYREILRLKSLGLNKTDIASAAQCARNTVSTTLARAKACGLQWPLPEGMSDKELEERLFPSAQAILSRGIAALQRKRKENATTPIREI